MRVVQFYSTAAATSAAALTYTVPTRSKLVAVRWHQYLSVTGIQGLRWSLSLVPSDTSTVNGSESIISSIVTLATSGTVGVMNNVYDNFQSPFQLDPGQILYGHCLTIVGAPATAAAMFLELQFV